MNKKSHANGVTFSVSKKSTRWQTVEKECRLSDIKFVAVQKYGRVCYRAKQKDVARATSPLLKSHIFRFYIFLYIIFFCDLCLCLQR